MESNKKSISRLAVAVLGALLVGLPATAARAAEPTTASEAAAMAQRYRQQADHYRALGGVAYKSGIVQRAEADAAKYSALAEQLGEPPAETPVRSPEAEHYAELAQRYRAMGGPAYKSGRVQWAEAQQREAEAAPVPPAAPGEPIYRPACAAISKPVVVRTLACAK
jgi:hypothetical protein